MNQQLDAAQRHGVDWLVFTEHSNTGHRKQGIYDQYEELQRDAAVATCSSSMASSGTSPAPSTAQCSPPPAVSSSRRCAPSSWSTTASSTSGRGHPAAPPTRPPGSRRPSRPSHGWGSRRSAA
ncbi:hypothetical protein [Luteococcus sp.]|uniref:hypothetical protein n=1 Tax=Luteococcus sp. TaxID=1969402 RepID=UPI0034635AE5